MQKSGPRKGQPRGPLGKQIDSSGKEMQRKNDRAETANEKEKQRGVPSFYGNTQKETTNKQKGFPLHRGKEGQSAEEKLASHQVFLAKNSIGKRKG